jgi:hypothetical protein
MKETYQKLDIPEQSKIEIEKKIKKRMMFLLSHIRKRTRRINRKRKRKIKTRRKMRMIQTNLKQNIQTW